MWEQSATAFRIQSAYHLMIKLGKHSEAVTFSSISIGTIIAPLQSTDEITNLSYHSPVDFNCIVNAPEYLCCLDYDVHGIPN